MGSKAKDTVSPISKAIIDVCRDLLGSYKGTSREFFNKSGISANYWYKRMRYEMPFNTSDIDAIARFFNHDSLYIYQMADARIHGKVISKDDMTLAAMRDPQKRYHELGGAIGQDDDENI